MPVPVIRDGLSDGNCSMRGFSDRLLRTGLDALYYSGVYHLLAPATAGRGAIFALHRVLPPPAEGAFAPNHALEITPDFLDMVLQELRRREVDIVDLDEAVTRLTDGSDRHFAVFTFDDGYGDSLRATLPIFERYRAPFTVYVATGLIDGTADIWWLMLEAAIARRERIQTTIADTAFDLHARTPEEKQAAWDALYWPLRDLSVAARRSAVAALAGDAIDEKQLCASVAATWDELRHAARHELITIGAHTLHHPPLSQLPAAEAAFEMTESRQRLERELGTAVRHFAYPFGDRGSAGEREFALARGAGFATAVTTRRGPLHAGHAQHLHALPRVSLNGNYQAKRYFDLFLSGAPFLLWNGARKLDVA
jgi:peptidoglycan/xylan/chitin deacetylase (PgdA/CDA1 family)